MTLDEIILSENVLFDENGKLRESGNKFLEHISKYAETIVLLGFKSGNAQELSRYINNHLKTTNLTITTNSELGYHLLEKGELNPINCIYIGTNEVEIKESIDWKINSISFKHKPLNSSIPYFKELKDITRYLSNLK